MNNFIVVTPINDAESVVIKEMLEKNKIEHYVTTQSWGASWAGLENEIVEKINSAISEGKTVYGVELKGPAPVGCKNIDHHFYFGDDRTTKKSSLEQVAELLGIKKLTSFEQFVAANDVGHVSGMMKLGQKLHIPGAEVLYLVHQVRKMDRDAQGITEDEMALAKKAISSKTQIKSVIVVNLPHSKATTVTDQMIGAYTRLLVITPTISVFFGDGKTVLALKEYFSAKGVNCWAGGDLPNEGFFGSALADPEEIKNYIKNCSIFD